MAQKQYTNYRSDILSFELRDALVGVLKPGRYIGYNTVAYGAQAVNDIPIIISHDNGINKYDTDYPTPVLEAQRGVAVTTQGTIIAEDGDVSLTLTLRNHISGGVHLVYMRHAYIDTVGGDTALYNIVSADRTSGQPALPNPSRDVTLGVFIEDPNATDSSGLTYYPFYPAVGDDQLRKVLFQNNGGAYDTLDEGVIPVDGIIGDRLFSSNNYLTDEVSLTEALSDLDYFLQIEEDARVALGQRALDHPSWGALSDNELHNATSLRHGLLPKLGGNSTVFLSGEGTWIQPQGGLYTKFIRGFNGDHFSIDTGGNDSQTFDLTSYTDARTAAVFLQITGRMNTDATVSVDFSMYPMGESAASGAVIRLKHDNVTTLYKDIYHLWVPVKLDNVVSDQSITVTLTNAGLMSQVSYLSFKILAYQTRDYNDLD